MSMSEKGYPASGYLFGWEGNVLGRDEVVERQPIELGRRVAEQKRTDGPMDVVTPREGDSPVVEFAQLLGPAERLADELDR